MKLGVPIPIRRLVRRRQLRRALRLLDEREVAMLARLREHRRAVDEELDALARREQ